MGTFRAFSTLRLHTQGCVGLCGSSVAQVQRSAVLCGASARSGQVRKEEREGGSAGAFAEAALLIIAENSS